MKINNMDKFRDNIAEALETTFAVTCYESIGKTQAAADDALEYTVNTYDYMNIPANCIGLYKPIRVYQYGHSKEDCIYITFADYGIRFFFERENCFAPYHNINFREYRNQLQLAIVITDIIRDMLNWLENENK